MVQVHKLAHAFSQASTTSAMSSITHFYTKTVRQDHREWHDCNENEFDKFILFMIYSMTVSGSTKTPNG
jgi:hypothetical protein